jgi:hypothetical protein
MGVFKEITFDEQLGDYVINDQRVFSECVDFQLKQIRQKARDLILENAPEYKQRNAALGLLRAQEEQQVKDAIQEIRTISNSLEQQILSVSWDGQESSRAAACDAVQNIRWP